MNEQQISADLGETIPDTLPNLEPNELVITVTQSRTSQGSYASSVWLSRRCRRFYAVGILMEAATRNALDRSYCQTLEASQGLNSFLEGDRPLTDLTAVIRRIRTPQGDQTFLYTNRLARQPYLTGLIYEAIAILQAIPREVDYCDDTPCSFAADVIKLDATAGYYDPPDDDSMSV